MDTAATGDTFDISNNDRLGKSEVRISRSCRLKNDFLSCCWLCLFVYMFSGTSSPSSASSKTDLSHCFAAEINFGACVFVGGVGPAGSRRGQLPD